MRVPFRPVKIVGVACSLALSCWVAPRAVFTMSPLADQTVWLVGSAYAKAGHDSLLLISAFDRSFQGTAIVDV